MPNGTVKLYHADRKFGFINTENGTELFVGEDDLDGLTIKAGDRISYEVAEGDSGKKATQVAVLASVADDTPVGRTLAPPPDWFSIEDRSRGRRRNRRSRR